MPVDVIKSNETMPSEMFSRLLASKCWVGDFNELGHKFWIIQIVSFQLARCLIPPFLYKYLPVRPVKPIFTISIIV